MVDCGTARCLQERKDLKKELLSWSRKIPLAIGLESVATGLAGKLDITQLFQPWSDTKEEDTTDWTPPEHCFYCSDKISNHPMRSCVTDGGLELPGYSDSLDGEPLDLSSTATPLSPSTCDEASPIKHHVELIVPVIKKSEPKPPKRSATTTIDAPSNKSRRSLYKSLDLNMTSDFLPFYSLDDWDQKLKEIRRKHNLNGKRRDTFYSHAPYQHELTLPFLPELIRKMAHETMRSRCADDQPKDLSIRGADEPLDLKIPSYQSEENHHVRESRDESLKDIITKTISDKIRSRYPYSTPALPPLLPAPIPASYNSLQNLVNGQNPIRPEPVQQKKTKKPKEDPNREPGRKGSRPKRGQYRKYNNQLLVEAVKAVQRGEMSVHRAGSYYGVPHSTLEYKVKERHLLRKKKKEAEKAALAEQQAKEGKETSITPPKPVLQPKSVNGNNNKIKNILPASQVQYNASPLLANPALYAWPLESAFLAPQMLLPGVMGVEQDLMYPGGYAMTAPASEMLKKLQQKASSGAVFPGMIETAGSDDK